MEYFKTIAEVENISIAAKELHLAQPYLSRKLKALEEQLGVLLFDRRGKSIHINENGRILLRYAKVFFSLHNEMLETLKYQNTNVLRIGIFNTTNIFPGMIALFAKQHPTIRIKLRKMANLDDIPDNCDVLLHASQKLARRMHSVCLLDEDCLLGMNRKHILACANEITAELLSEHPILLLEQTNALGELTYNYCEQLGLKNNIILQCDNQQTLSCLVAEGMGLAFFPAQTWKIESEEILLRKIKGYDLKRKIYLSTPMASPLVVKIFCKFVKRYFAV